MTEEEARRIRVSKRKGREEDGTEDGRAERKRRLGKGKEKERTEEAENEWRQKMEERMAGLEKVTADGFWGVLERVGELVREMGRLREELAEVKEMVDSRGLGSEGSERLEELEELEEGEGEEDGEEKDEEMAAVEEMVDGEAGGESEGGGAGMVE